MVQFFQGREDPRAAQWAGVGSALGEGIGGGLNAYFSNKAIEAAANNPENKNLPLSERFGKLQQAAAPYGPASEKRLNQRMQYMEQEHTRGLLQNALGDVDKLVKSGASPSEIAIGATKAFAGIPGGDRLAQAVLPTMLNQAAATRRYGQKNQQQPQNQQPSGNRQTPYAPFGAGPQSQVQGIPSPQNQQAGGMGQPAQQQQPPIQYNQPQGDLQQVVDSDYNIKTPQQIIDNARADAEQSGDPNRYATALAEGEAENTLNKQHKDYLENIAQTSGSISKEDLPKFMLAAKGIQTNNPDQWLEQAMDRWTPIKDSYKRLSNAFIPGLDSALTGQNRPEALKRMIPNSQDLVKKGQERPLREFLNNNYLTPTEVEEQIHPLKENTEKSLEKLQKGIFPAKKLAKWSDIPKMFTEQKLEKNPLVSYETAEEKAPKAMKTMQNNLANFFLKNVNEDTSLAVLRDKLWNEKDYDWRQIGPAIEQAKQMGLKLSPNQDTELAHISTTPPYQSLPDILMSSDRIVKLVRGNK